MINIDVLLQAAEFIEKQQQQHQHTQQQHVNNSNYACNESSLLSPSSSSSSSSSSSCSSSASPETCQNLANDTPLPNLNSFINHKKFSKRSGKDQDISKPSFNLKDQIYEKGFVSSDGSISFFNSNQLSPLSNTILNNSKSLLSHQNGRNINSNNFTMHQYNRSSPVNTMSPNALMSIPSPTCSGNTASMTTTLVGSLGSNSSIPFPSPSFSSSSSSSVYSFSCHDTNNNKSMQQKQSHSSSSSRLEEIKRDKAIHNTLEKNRRAHLKECFERLQNELPQYKDKKVTNLLILNYTLKYVEQSKRKDRENEFDKQRLLKQQHQLKATLKNLISELETEEGFDLKSWLANNKMPTNTADLVGASSSASSNSNDSILNVDNDSMDKNDLIDDSFNKNEQNCDDESAASTSTASEANEYLKTKRGKKLNNQLGFKQNGSSDKQNKIYHRKRCSNSLSINTSTSPLNFLSKHSKSKHIQQQLQQQLQQSYSNNNAPNMLGTQSKDETIRSQQQQQQQQKQQNDLKHQQLLQKKLQQRQRHFSVDENMISHARKRNSSSINIEEENTDEYLFEDDIDDVDDEDESNYGNWNEDDDCDVDNDDDDNESSELMIDEDEASPNINTNSNLVKTNFSNTTNSTTTNPPLNTTNDAHQQNKALKLLSLNDSSSLVTTNNVLNNGLAKINFKIIDNGRDEKQKNSHHLNSFTTDNLNNNANSGLKQRRSRNSSLCIDNTNTNTNFNSIKQQQHQPQPIENLNAVNFSKSLVSQINGTNSANLNTTIQSLNPSGTAKFVVVKNTNSDSNPTQPLNTPKSIIQLNQQAFLPQAFLKSSNAPGILQQGTIASSSQTLIARDLINKNIINTSFQQQQQRPLEHQFFQGSSGNSFQMNSFNLPPQNLINVPFFKSISIQQNGNSSSSSGGNTSTGLTSSQIQPMDTTNNQESSKQQQSLNAYMDLIQSFKAGQTATTTTTSLQIQHLLNQSMQSMIQTTRQQQQDSRKTPTNESN